MPDEPGIAVTKDCYPSGALKTLTRRRLADGLLLAKWHYGTNGVITQVEDYDPRGLYVMRTLFKWEDGSSIEYWFDEQHRLWMEIREEPPTSDLDAIVTRVPRVFLLQGRVTLNPRHAWWGYAHKLNDSKDTVTFNVASTNAVVSVTARDLAQPTTRDALPVALYHYVVLDRDLVAAKLIGDLDRAAFALLTTSARDAATRTSHLAAWSIYAIGEKRGETQVEVKDCFLEIPERLGVHVRLTMDAPAMLTKDRGYMEEEFKRFLEEVEAKQTK